MIFANDSSKYRLNLCAVRRWFNCATNGSEATPLRTYLELPALTISYINCIIITIPLFNAMIQNGIQLLFLLFGQRPYPAADEMATMIKPYLNFCLKHFGCNA